MASFFYTYSLLLLFLNVSLVPSSMAKDFRGIVCARTQNPSSCISLDHVRNAPNTRGLVKTSIDLALTKAAAIHSQLNYNYKAERDQRLKDIYYICSKNYNDAIRDLTTAQNTFYNNKRFRTVPYELKDAEEEIKDCKTVFDSVTQDFWNLKQWHDDTYLLTQIAQIGSEIITKNY